MSRVSFSHEGVHELRGLGNSLLQVNMNIDEITRRLSTNIGAVETGLGEFAPRVRDLIDNVVSISKESQAEIIQLEILIIKLADDMEEVLKSL